MMSIQQPNPYFSQRDPKWENIHLGSSSLTIGGDGCADTCLAMVAEEYGEPITPDKIAQSGWLDADGSINWTKINFKNFDFRWREGESSKNGWSRDDILIKNYLNEADKAVILNVNDGKHWILPIAWMPYDNDYLCIDPWTYPSHTCMAIRDYKNIVGSVHLIAKGKGVNKLKPIAPNFD